MRTSGSRRTGGFTLVELLVALAIGLILMTGIYQFFIAQRRTYTAQDEVNRLQADARVAEQLVSKALQQTGAFSPTVGATVSMRGQVVLAASDHYLVVQADDPYRSSDQGIITADEVIAFAVSKPGGAATERIGDDPTVTNKLTRTVRVFYDQDTPPNGVDADEAVDVQIPLALGGPPYVLYRITPDPAGGTAPTLETVAANVDNFVLRFYDQNGDLIVPHDAGGNPLPTYQPLGADDRSRIRAVEINLTMRTRNPDPKFQASFAVPDNTVATYDNTGVPQTAVAFTNDGYRRRTFHTRISPRNLSAHSCGRITLTAGPAQPTCGNSAAVKAVVIDQYGDPVSAQDVVFQLDPTTGASFSALPIVTTTTTVTTNANGEASATVDYQSLSQAVSVSTTAEVDCRPTGPEFFTLQNATSIQYVSGFADRVELTNLPTTDVDTYKSPPSAKCTENTWTFDAAGFDVCGNPAAEDPSNPFQFEAVNGTIASDTLDSATKTFTVTLGGASGVTTSNLALSAGAGLGVPSEIQVDGTPYTAPYGPLYTVNLHPWPPAEIVPDPAIWLDAFDPTPPATVYLDCADSTVLTSDPFELEDCAQNKVTEILSSMGSPQFQLTPTLTGPGTLAVVDNGASSRTLQYTLDGCGTPPGQSITTQAGVELQNPSNAILDSAGPKGIPVEGCAAYTVTVVKNPTLCDLRGTIQIAGCDMTGKSIEVVLSTTGGNAVASFAPPLSPVQSILPFTFANNNPLQLDIYVTKANAGDQIAVTAYYPNMASNFYSNSATLTVDTHCEAVELYASKFFNTNDRIQTGGTITCLEQIKEIHVRVKDCQSSTVSPYKEVTLELYANGALYDRERIDLIITDPADVNYLISDPNDPLLVGLDDGLDIYGNNRLAYPAGKTIRLIATYRDSIDNETCVETVENLTSPASVCFYNALASGGNADLPPNLEVHWGDVVVEGTADLQAAAPTMSKRSGATLTSTVSDRFLDVYLGKDAGGGGGYYLISSGDTSAGDFRPFLTSDDLGNYFQNVSNIGIQTLAPDLDHDALRDFAKGQNAYWYAVTGASCSDGPLLSDTAGITTCLSNVLTGTDPFVFIDTFGAPGVPPTANGTDIDAAPLSGAGALPAWTLGNIFTGDIPHRAIYIAGSITFITTGGGSTLSLSSPPQQDVHYNDNPLPGTGIPSWSPSEVDLPIEFDTAASTQTITLPGVNVRAGLYLDGQVSFDGSPVIFGSLVAERGLRYLSGNPEVWYDHDLRGASSTTCSQCGQRPVTGCGLNVTPATLNFSNPLQWAHLTVNGTLGLFSGTVDDPSIANFNSLTRWTRGLDVGTTTLRLHDSLQPACAVEVPVTVGCSPGLAAGTTSLNFGPINNATTLLGNGSLLWSAGSGTAVTLSGSNPAASIGVHAARVGTTDVSGTFLGTSCTGSLGFTVGCGVTASISSATPPGNVLFPGGADITLQAAYASGGVDRWEEVAPVTPGLSIASSGSTATVSLSGGGPANTTATTVDVYDVDGCKSSPGAGLVICPLAVDAGTGTVYVGDTLSLSVTGDSGIGALWSCTPAPSGTVSLSTPTGPGTVVTGLSAGTVTCRAEDAAYGNCYDEATVTVQDCPTAITPDTATVRPDDSGSLTLTASGFTGNVTWAQSSTDGGTLTLSPASPPGGTAQVSVDLSNTVGAVEITASDATFPACPATATITVAPPACPLAFSDDFADGVLDANWSNQDIGGSWAGTGVSESGGTLTITGQGADIWGTSDQFHFAYLPPLDAADDFVMTVRVMSQQNVNFWSKAGLMVRDSLAANARFVDIVAAPNHNNHRLNYRSTTGGSSVSSGDYFTTDPPYYWRLTKTGNQYTASWSTDGVTFTSYLVGGSPVSATVSMSGTIYVGLAVTSHNSGATGTAEFDDFQIACP